MLDVPLLTSWYKTDAVTTTYSSIFTLPGLTCSFLISRNSFDPLVPFIFWISCCFLFLPVLFPVSLYEPPHFLPPHSPWQLHKLQQGTLDIAHVHLLLLKYLRELVQGPFCLLWLYPHLQPIVGKLLPFSSRNNKEKLPGMVYDTKKMFVQLVRPGRLLVVWYGEWS